MFLNLDDNSMRDMLRFYEYVLIIYFVLGICLIESRLGFG